jgi:[lysine-biosynthesis-protein LysW]--L-2-aminoadipate ligase
MLTARDSYPLAILASRIRTEERWLLDALDRRKVAYQVVDTRRTSFRLDRPRVPYRVALIREISYHRALSAARVLAHLGCQTVNSAEAIAVCGDKLMTTLALLANGIPTPRCLIALTPEGALEALDEFGYPAVTKPLTGSWGRLAARLADRDAAQSVLEHRSALPGAHQHITYVQEYVNKPGRDIRGLVFGGEVAGAVYRMSAGDWRTNTARNAVTRACRVSDELAGLLVCAAAAIGPGAYAVDVLEDQDGGLYVNEINHTPEFRGAAEVIGPSLVARLVDYVLSELGLANAA